MKAIVLREFGGAEKLLWEEVPVPIIGQGEALFRVGAAAVSPMDVATREGTSGYGGDLPFIPGRLAAGEVVEVGKQVTRLRPGDRVLVYGYVTCGTCASCQDGSENLCPLDPTKKERIAIFGGNTDGGYAEYAKWPADYLVLLRGNVAFEDAIGIWDLASTWHALIERARVQAGEDILILSGGSSTATAAIQVAHAAGARIFVTTSTDEKAEHARSLGADFVINYRQADFSQEVLRLTEGRGVDVILEVSGQATFSYSSACLAARGRLIVYGFLTGRQGSFNLMDMARREHTFIGAAASTRATTEKVAQMMEEGKFRTVVHQVYPLQEVPLAQKIWQRGEHVGKILVRP